MNNKNHNNTHNFVITISVSEPWRYDAMVSYLSCFNQYLFNTKGMTCISILMVLKYVTTDSIELAFVTSHPKELIEKIIIEYIGLLNGSSKITIDNSLVDKNDMRIFKKILDTNIKTYNNNCATAYRLALRSKNGR